MAWIGVYPFVTLISWGFGELLLSVPLAIRTLFLSGLVVGYMIFFWIPFIQRFNRAR
jgi:antibiotic biosynthesis monooxygenase (ABM) superfamily enzyme